MSKHSAPRSPEASAAQAAPAAPPAGPESTVRAACARACSSVASPPEDCMTSGSGSPASARAARERGEVGAQQRREGGVELGRGGALVLAERAHDLVRERDVHAGQPVAQRRAECALVRGMAVGVQEADGDRLGVERGDPLRQPGGILERAARAVGRHPLGCSDAALRRHERRRMRGAQAVEVRAGLAAELDEVLEALRRDEHRARAAPLQQRVRRDRRAVRERAHVLGGRPGAVQGRADGGEHTLGLVVGGGRRLRGHQPPVDGDDGVGEGAADVDAEEHGRM